MTPLEQLTRLTQIKDQLIAVSRFRSLTDTERRILGRVVNALNRK